MMILAHSIKHLKNNGTEHAIIFEFESKRFEAIVVNAKEALFLNVCCLKIEKSLKLISLFILVLALQAWLKECFLIKY